MGSSFCVLAGFAVLAFCVARRKPLLFCSAVLTLACCFAQDAKLPPGSIAGEVFNTGADGQRAVVPGAHDQPPRPGGAPDGIGRDRPIPL